MVHRKQTGKKGFPSVECATYNPTEGQSKHSRSNSRLWETVPRIVLGVAPDIQALLYGRPKLSNGGVNAPALFRGPLLQDFRR
jgi:hypothetical protein